jgi:hypothetical protein
MSETNETPENAEITVPGYPKTLAPYRHKLRNSAMAIAMAVSGKRNMTKEHQVTVLKAVIAELRKMTAGAVKALEIAEGRDYDAYLAAKQAVKEGKLTADEQVKFDALIAGLAGEGEYDFSGEPLDEDGEAAMAKLDEVNVADEGPTEN